MAVDGELSTTKRALLPIWLVAGAAALTMAMAVGAGLLALRSLRLLEPAQLLR